MNLRRLALPPLALVIAWAAAVWWPIRSMTDSERNRLEDIQAEQLSRVAALDELATAEDLAPLFEADLLAFAAAVPGRLDMPELLRQLDAEADATGLRIELFAPTEVIAGTGLAGRRTVPAGMSAVGLALTGQGTFEATMAFIERLQESSRLVVIDRLGLRAVDDGASEVIVDLEFRVFTSDSVSSGAQSPPPSADPALPVDPLTDQELSSMRREDTSDREPAEDPQSATGEDR